MISQLTVKYFDRILINTLLRYKQKPKNLANKLQLLIFA